MLETVSGGWRTIPGATSDIIEYVENKIIEILCLSALVPRHVIICGAWNLGSIHLSIYTRWERSRLHVSSGLNIGEEEFIILA
jgi:hypothetical protein